MVIRDQITTGLTVGEIRFPINELTLIKMREENIVNELAEKRITNQAPYKIRREYIREIERKLWDAMDKEFRLRNVGTPEELWAVRERVKRLRNIYENYKL